MLNESALGLAKKTKNSALRDITSMLLLALGILTLFALMSYHSQDVSWNVSSSGVVHNWIGPAGAYWSDLLLQSFGLCAGLLALLLVISGLMTLLGITVQLQIRRFAGIVCCLLAFALAAQLVFQHRNWPYPPGGLPGALLAAVLVQWLAPLGASVMAATLMLIGLGLATRGMLQRVFGFAVYRSTAWLQARWQRWVPTTAMAEATPVLSLEDDETSADPTDERGLVVASVLSSNDSVGLEEDTAMVPMASPQQDLSPPLWNDAAFSEAPVSSATAPFQTVSFVEEDTLTAAALAVEETEEVFELGNEATKPPPLLALPLQTSDSYVMPMLSLLDYEAVAPKPIDADLLRDNALRLTKTLADYGIEGHVREIRPGPVVTMYEYVPAPGIKLSKINSLADDLAMSMEALRVRIVAPIPGKGAVGIEIPNEEREVVYLREILAHEAFADAVSPLTLGLGKDIEGNAFVTDLAKMPHLLVAGATGAGKSVSINAMIMSILLKASPKQVRMIMIDPKMLELSVYEGIPHLLLPVVTDAKKAKEALAWVVAEMERRYELLSEVGARGIDAYNQKVTSQAMYVRDKECPDEQLLCEPIPYILVVVDELADLMMVASREVETYIMRLAQMARAAGIHLILATQRPSVDVLTGVIKANFPTRIAFQVASRHDSRTILDANGAEHLLGKGDMLILSAGVNGIERVHGAYVSDNDIAHTVEAIRAQGEPQYDETILQHLDDAATEDDTQQESGADDEMYAQAVQIATEHGSASISMIQRRLHIGFNRAARLVDRMEEEGIVGPAEGKGPREVRLGAS